MRCPVVSGIAICAAWTQARNRIGNLERSCLVANGFMATRSGLHQCLENPSILPDRDHIFISTLSKTPAFQGDWLNCLSEGGYRGVCAKPPAQPSARGVPARFTSACPAARAWLYAAPLAPHTGARNVVASGPEPGGSSRAIRAAPRRGRRVSRCVSRRDRRGPWAERLRQEHSSRPGGRST